MFILQQKLKKLKLSLKDWNKNVFGNVHEVVVDKQKILLSLQHQIQVANPVEMDMLLVQQQQAMQNPDMTLDCQVFFRKEKAKMLWFKDKDHNSSFFHAMVKKCANSNGIQKLVDGDLVLKILKILKNISFYKTLYDSSDSNNVSTNFREYMIVAHIPRVVFEDKNSMLVRCPSNDEIKKVVFALNSNSAPGPDGFGGTFFHGC